MVMRITLSQLKRSESQKRFFEYKIAVRILLCSSLDSTVADYSLVRGSPLHFFNFLSILMNFLQFYSLNLKKFQNLDRVIGKIIAGI
jgi:hypothetical protein